MEKCPNTDPLDGDYERFDFGPFVFERRGRFISARSTISEDDQEEFRRALAKLHSESKGEINATIKAQLDILRNYNPLELLQDICFKNCFYDPDTYSESTHEGHEAYAEYALSLALSVPFEGEPKSPDKDEIEEFERNIEMIFNDVIWFFTTEHSSVEQKNDFDRFRFTSIASKLILRGDSVEPHHIYLVKGLFEPHDELLIQHYGYDTRQILLYIEEIRNQVQNNFLAQLDTLTKIKELHKEFCDYVDKLGEIQKPVEAVFEDFLSINGNRNKKEEIDSRQSCLQKNVCEISPNERLPHDFIKSLSSRFGDNSKFIEGGSDAGWPLRDSIIYNRPIVEHQGKFYCFVPQILFRNIVEILEGWIQASDNRYYERRYQKRKGEYLEEMSLEYIAALFPGSEVYGKLYYRIEENGASKRVETDGLVIYDDNLFIIEAKAGKLHPSAHRGSIIKIKNDVGKLISDAYDQALRTKNYILSVSEPAFEYQSGKTALKIENPSKFRNIFLVNTTLENLGELSTHLNSLRRYNLIEGKEWPWSVYINDLRVISELIETPSEFLLYLQRRIRANDFPAFSAADELDFFSVFLREGLYFEDGQLGSADVYRVAGYTDAIDRYYHAEMGLTSSGEKPKRNIPEDYRDLIRKIEATQKFGFSFVTTTLSSFDSEIHLEIIGCIKSLICRANEDKKCHNAIFLSQDLNLGLTIVVDPSGTCNPLEYEVYCIPKKYQTRFDTWIILLLTCTEGQIKHVDFNVLRGNGRYSAGYKKPLKRVEISDTDAHPDAGRKIGRNEKCPCGSGKKFKRCCGRSGEKG